MEKNLLHTEIEFLKGVGTSKAKLLKSELNIHSYYDLMHYFPYRYVDKSKFYKINEIGNSSAEIQLKGHIVSIKEVEQKKGKRLVADFKDDTGNVELVWFQHSKWLRDSILLNKEVVIFGKISEFNGKLNMVHPEMDFQTDEKKSGISFQPIYSLTDKLIKNNFNQRTFLKLFIELFNQIYTIIPENLSDSILKENTLISRKEAFFSIHFPSNYEKLKQAEMRLKFEEIFYFQLGFGLRKVERITKFRGNPMLKIGQNFNDFYQNYLPFELTNAQKRVVKEIRQDLKKNIQMNRLLQGDVGSGKTAVALLSTLIAKDNGFQSCFLAPTEILATQHYNGLEELLQNMNVNVALLTGSTSIKQRKIIHSQLETGELDILVGTHAVLENKVLFKNLGLAIIDEQHRFGVAQRSKLWTKNTIPPHILVMTATPIPRTLAMSFYSDLDVSVIDEMPKGRKPIQTIHKKDKDRLALFGFMKKEIAKGRQVYVVYPLIKESEKLDYKDLVDGYESITREFPIPKYHVSVVHGQMKSADKEFEMQRFVRGETQIMVATTVIEVGVNVPNASVMVIESAERFGLSQLHQLRGRVGRGSDQSYCILMTKDFISEDSFKRISTMCETNDGFRISEVDLEMRGPGDILGTQQSGIIDFKIANLVKDKQLISITKNAVEVLLQNDSNLNKEENSRIKNHFLTYHKEKISWSRIS